MAVSSRSSPLLAVWRGLPRRSRTLLAAVALAALAALALAHVVLPLREARRLEARQVGEMRTALETARAQLEALRGQIAGGAALGRELEDLRASLDAVLSRVPEGRSLSAFLRDLTTSRESAAVVMHSLVPKPPEQRGEFLELPFTLEVEGTYHALASYLAYLESSVRPVRIRTLSIRSQGDQKTTLRVSLLGGTLVAGGGS